MGLISGRLTPDSVLYWYGRNDPVSAKDPLGLWCYDSPEWKQLANCSVTAQNGPTPWDVALAVCQCVCGYSEKGAECARGCADRVADWYAKKCCKTGGSGGGRGH